jgi:hypothetical protein
MSGGKHLRICENLAVLQQRLREIVCVARPGCEAVARKLRESCDMRKITSRTCLSIVALPRPQMNIGYAQQCRLQSVEDEDHFIFESLSVQYIACV